VLIEDAITNETTGILATHVFGNPCDIEAIQEIADRHNLKVIYDAAHCFGTKYKGKSVFEYGDISTASFHATKLFHTVEGGAVISNDEDLIERMAFMRNFGHDGPGKFNGVGINGKNSEYHAAMGLCNLDYIESILNVRKEQYKTYDELLSEKNPKGQKIEQETKYNYSYFPVIFDNEKETINCKVKLEKEGISPRRYFYPSLNDLSYVEGSCPISIDISKTILCLPLYHELNSSVQKTITSIIFETLSDVSKPLNN
jgi:dTDP-4-amino-4,6-dideoxygalactose transaminase